MKKALILLAVLATASVLFSSCHSAKACPAYSKAEKPATEKAV